MNWPAFPEPGGHSPSAGVARSSPYPPSPNRNVNYPMPSPSQPVGTPRSAGYQEIYADGQAIRVPPGAEVIYVEGRHRHHSHSHSSHGQHHPSGHGRSHSYSRPPAQSHHHSHSQPQYNQPQYSQSQYLQRHHAQYLVHAQHGGLVPLQHPDFQYSRCTGRKKALLIGINYTGQREELRGCINDAKSMYYFLRERYGFRKEDMVLLRDDAHNPRDIPTKKNMLDAMRWLVKDAQPHDSLFIHYSGHGGQTKDLDGDEVDGLDEVIFPLDYKKAGTITDDVLNEILVKSLPKACRLTAVFDSCHSGSILDLPFLYHSDGRIKRSQVTDKFRKQRSTPADVVSFSGCKDAQTSADTYEGGLAVGAMSYAFALSLKRSPEQTYAQLLRSVREILNKKYSQKPQLTCSHRLDTNLKFII